MKKTVEALICIIFVFIMCVSFAACNNTKEPADVWENAVYTEDTELGDGSEKLEVEVKAEDKSVMFTLHTDKETVGEALMEHDLISGEDGAYGLYVKVVNGITADYDVNQCYWAFNKNGEYMPTGVDQTSFSDGDCFELVYTKQE